MPRFRKIPVEIEAVQLSWRTWSDICDLIERHCGDGPRPYPAREIPAAEASDSCGEPGPTYIALDVTTLHGEIAVVRHGDWLVPEPEPGRFYPIKPDVFARTYEPVSSTSTANVSTVASPSSSSA